MSLSAALLGLWRPRAPDRIPIRGVYRFRFHDARTGRLVRERVYENIACVNGKAAIASWLNAELSAAPTIYGAIGTGALGGGPFATDTQLVTELSRLLAATNSRTGNVVVWDFFWTTTQGNGVLTEAGVFINGTAVANSGNLVSHVAISENKTIAETLTVEISIQIG